MLSIVWLAIVAMMLGERIIDALNTPVEETSASKNLSVISTNNRKANIA